MRNSVRGNGDGPTAAREGTTMSAGKSLLVGVDGSPGSRLALAWAPNQASLGGADLVALNVWEPPLLPPLGIGSVPGGRPPDLAEEAAGCGGAPPPPAGRKPGNTWGGS